MSKNKNNYNKMYDAAGKKEDTIPAEVTEEVVEAVETAVAEPAVETVKMERSIDAGAAAQSKPAKSKTKAKALTGAVTCELLNVRVAPNKEATIECVLTKGSKVDINLSESTDGWYKVVTADKTTGYCMKKFVAV